MLAVTTELGRLFHIFTVGYRSLPQQTLTNLDRAVIYWSYPILASI